MMQPFAIVFPGQGSQHIGMGHILYKNDAMVRRVFEEANDTLGFDLANICFNGSLSELNKLEHMLTGILTVSIAYYRHFMKQIGLSPQMVLGHSLGEYSALVCSGVIDFQDALKIVWARSQQAKRIRDSDVGAMSIINGIYEGVVAYECKKITNQSQKLSIACYNSPFQVVVTGIQEAVQELENCVSKMGGQITPLLFTPPFHSPLMLPMVSPFENELKKYKFHQFTLPIISNMTGLPYNKNFDVRKSLLQHLIKPVLWQKSFDYIYDSGVTTIIEIGPQSILTDLLRTFSKNFKLFSYSNDKSRDILINSLLKAGEIRVTCRNTSCNAEKYVALCITAAVSTKNYNKDTDMYKEGVIKPYEEILQIQNEVQDHKIKFDNDIEKKVWSCLKKIMITKKVPVIDQRRWFNRIYNESRIG